jgi:hypothetical protein
LVIVLIAAISQLKHKTPMEKKLILLTAINKERVAIAGPKGTKEALVFMAARLGAKKMMIVNITTNELLVGEKEFEEAQQRGDTETEVLSCDPASPAITELAALNSDNSMAGLKEAKEYGYVDPWEFERDKEHAAHLPYDDVTEFEGTTESYQKYDRIKPVYYVEFYDGEKLVKAVIDGWKFVVYARAQGIKKVFACKLNVGNNDDLLSIMLQLQRSNHDSYLALYYMIEALWPKYYLGQGYRSDLTNKEFEEDTENPKGKKPTIYQLIGRELNLKPHKVKYIRKIGKVNPRQFIQMDTERPSLYAIYNQCNNQEKGVMPEVPAVKPPTYHSTSTGAPVFTTPTTTADHFDNSSDSSATTGSHADSPTTANSIEIPIGEVVAIDDEFITVTGPCQCCRKMTTMKIRKTQLL